MLGAPKHSLSRNLSRAGLAASGVLAGRWTYAAVTPGLGCPVEGRALATFAGRLCGPVNARLEAAVSVVPLRWMAAGVHPDWNAEPTGNHLPFEGPRRVLGGRPPFAPGGPAG